MTRPVAVGVWAVALAAGMAAQSPVAPPTAVAPDKVVLRVGNETVTARQFEALLAGLPQQERAQAAAHKREVANEYAQVLTLEHEAERRHLDRSDAFAMEMRLTRERALADALIAQLRQEARPSDAALQAYYAGHPADFEQVRVRHILVADSATPGGKSHRTKAAARAKIEAIAARLKHGASFAALAAADSDDPGSKAKGGDLGFLAHGQTVAQFDRVVWSLQPGQVSAPFESPFGFHIVQVEARRTLPLTAVKEQIANQLATAAVRRQLAALTAAAQPQLDPAYFGPPPAAAPGPAAARKK